MGEPINPEVWMWYYNTLGEGRCPIVDTGKQKLGNFNCSTPGAIDLKPGSATKPFYGIKPVIVDEAGKVLKGACKGRLCMSASWPGQMRTAIEITKDLWILISLSLMENILLVMVAEEIKMVITDNRKS